MSQINKAIRQLSLGEKLGEGATRAVYACSLDPTLVVKIEKFERKFHNIGEWEYWQTFQYVKDVSVWLAPCVSISDCGSVLLMKRTNPLLTSDKLPTKLPFFLTDFKKENYGKLKNKVVCHDYASLILDVKTKLKTTRWEE